MRTVALVKAIVYIWQSTSVPSRADSECSIHAHVVAAVLCSCETSLNILQYSLLQPASLQLALSSAHGQTPSVSTSASTLGAPRAKAPHEWYGRCRELFALLDVWGATFLYLIYQVNSKPTLCHAGVISHLKMGRSHLYVMHVCLKCGDLPLTSSAAADTQSSDTQLSKVSQ